MRFVRAAAVLLLAAASSASAADGGVVKSHGIAIHGGPGYPAGFTHFSYVDPKAPKGGKRPARKAAGAKEKASAAKTRSVAP